MKISSHSSNHSIRFYFVAFFSFSSMLYGGHLFTSACIPQVNLVLAQNNKEANKTKNYAFLQIIVKISLIFLLYQWKLSQCQFISAFSVLNRFANKRNAVGRDRVGVSLYIWQVKLHSFCWSFLRDILTLARCCELLLVSKEFTHKRVCKFIVLRLFHAFISNWHPVC